MIKVRDTIGKATRNSRNKDDLRLYGLIERVPRQSMEVDSLSWLQPIDKNDLSSETGMGKGKSRITRSTSPAQVTPSSQKTTAFYDGYDYQTLGLPPEDAPTKERKLANISKHRSQYPTRTKLQGDYTFGRAIILRSS